MIPIEVKSYELLTKIAHMTMSDVTFTLNDLDVSDIGNQVLPKFLHCKERFQHNQSRKFSKETEPTGSFLGLIPASPKLPVSTIIICASTPAVALLLKEKCEIAIERVANVLHSKQLILGRAECEKACINVLKDLHCAGTVEADHFMYNLSEWLLNDVHLFRNAITVQILHTMEKYCDLVQPNLFYSSSPRVILDDFQAIIQGWKYSLRCVVNISKNICET